MSLIQQHDANLNSNAADSIAGESILESHPSTTFHASPAFDSALASSPAVFSIISQPSMSADQHDQSARRGVVHTMLELQHGGVHSIDIAYEIQGRLDAPVIVVAGGISADRHVSSSTAFASAGWWEAQVGNGRPIDPKHHCILAINWLGSDGEVDAIIDTIDQARAVSLVLDTLHINAIEAFVGCSYGAMVGLQFAALFQSRLKHLIVISGAHRAHPFAVAWRDLQRRIVRFGEQAGDVTSALSLARQLAILSYRSPQEFAERFDHALTLTDTGVHCGSTSYLRHCGSKYVAKTKPLAFVRLSESIDLHALDPSSVRVPTTVIGVEEDFLVPIDFLRDLTRQIKSPTRLHILCSRFGHDAFLVEREAFDLLLRNALQELPRIAQTIGAPSARSEAAPPFLSSSPSKAQGNNSSSCANAGACP